MISHETIREEIEYYEAMKQSLSFKLRGLPKGNIYYKQEHGRKRPYVWLNGRERYLNAKEITTIRGLMSRSEIERSLKLIVENLSALERMDTTYHNLEELIPNTYKHPDTGLSRNKISKIVERWEKERKQDRLPAELFAGEQFVTDTENGADRIRKFKTSDGSYVKSKSELVIYEHLKLKGIPFIYESPHEINGQTRYPDFTIIRETDGLVILWEHFGMMALEWYKSNAQKKLLDYAEEGFWPFRNLITTFEFGDGDLDVAEIHRILVMMGLE